MVAEGRFREDLFYRINVIPIQLPPLRERARGHPAARRALPREVPRADGEADHRHLAGGAWRCSRRYDWPGNIRELENVIERAVALERTPTILPESLPEHVARRVARGAGTSADRAARRRASISSSTSRTSSATTSPQALRAGRRRAGEGRRAARHELPVVPLLREEIQPDVGRRGPTKTASPG